MMASRINNPIEKSDQCLFCDKKFAVQWHTNIHMQMHVNESPYFCKFWPEEFKVPLALKAHEKTHFADFEVKSFVCEICETKCKSQYYLIQHMTVHLEERPFQCTLCLKTFKRKVCLVSHQDVHRNRELPCSKCDKVFKTGGSLGHHIRRYHGNGYKKLPCDICQLEFTSRTSLSSHMNKHTGEKPCKCKFCKKAFRFQGSCRGHMERIHLRDSIPESFECPVCQKQFKWKTDLTNHLKIRSEERKHHCHICQMKFRTGSEMRKHVTRHTNEKSFQCRFCSKSFACSAGRYNHEKIHNEGSKIFSCDICDKKFRRKEHLEGHVGRHNNEYFHICVFCNHACSSPANLRAHLFVHTKEKRFICFKCGLECKQARVLRNHQRKPC